MNGFDLLSSAMHAAQNRLDVSTTNLANVSSDGFHKSVVRATLGPAGLSVRAALDPTEGALRHTGRPFDLALAGAGALFVADRNGAPVAVRGGAFERNGRGLLVDGSGRPLLGANGPVHVSSDATIDGRGIVREPSGNSVQLRRAGAAEIRSGFLESSNVDPVREMVDILNAQRSFETAQKTLGALDESRQKDVDDVARIRS